MSDVSSDSSTTLESAPKVATLVPKPTPKTTASVKAKSPSTTAKPTTSEYLSGIISRKNGNTLSLIAFIVGLCVLACALIPICRSNMNWGHELTDVPLMYLFGFLTFVYVVLGGMHYYGQYSYMETACHHKISVGYMLTAGFYAMLFALTYFVPRYQHLKFQIPNEFWYIVVGYIVMEFSYRMYTP